MKKCRKCGVEKPLTEFTKDSRKKDGLRIACRTCHNLYSRDINKRYLLRHPGRRSRVAYKAVLKKAYGLTPEGKENLILGQKGGCAICKEPFLASFNTHVDHVHGSSPIIIRGVLCNRCNFGLGHFKDSVERLASAIEYLKKFQKSP